MIPNGILSDSFCKKNPQKIENLSGVQILLIAEQFCTYYIVSIDKIVKLTCTMATMASDDNPYSMNLLFPKFSDPQRRAHLHH